MNTEDIELPPLPKASKMYDIPGYDEEELKDYARAAITAALPFLTVRWAVKKLKWKYVERTSMTYVTFDDRGMLYYINQSFGSDSYYFATFRYSDGKVLYDGDDLPSAKAAAQADYERRILAALEPAEPATDEARLREALANLVHEIDDLVSESEGVAGLHLNGDVAEWDDLLPGGPYERLSSLNDARAALKGASE